MGLIFYLSSLPGTAAPDSPPLIPFEDKIIHTVQYALLGVLFFYSFHLNVRVRRALLLAIVATCIYGITDEIHQSFVQGRYCSFQDMLADFFGAILGGVTAVLKRYGLGNVKESPTLQRDDIYGDSELPADESNSSL